MKYLAFFASMIYLVVGFVTNVSDPKRIDYWGLLMFLALWSYAAYIHEDLKEKIKNNNQ